ncbi:HYC_CC_PP family protein [Flavobacterium davisii]|uniref:Uncharacterized protein n=1 Tax=Flavobacterium columnare TaxID=996 RepID=A0A8G0KY43_9FLAO|nr:hypothetical protein [Flavobacterium davisii]QYS89725.1 hypothetical protein JJC05_05700 [Flavobacterium davisii]
MKFRNFIHITLALLVLVSNTGLAINVHYCGEVIAAISVESLKKNNSSGCCGDKKEVEDSCCKDKKVEIKESTSEKILIKSIQFESPVFITKEGFELVFNERIVNGVMVNNLPAYHCNTHAPPFYKLYSRLLFYA